MGPTYEGIFQVGARTVDFADASLGVPEPDKLYAQVITMV